MNHPENFLKKLGHLAAASGEPSEVPPFGFTARVRARLRETEGESLWVRWSLRTVPVAGAIAALLIALAAYETLSPTDDLSPAGMADEIVLSALDL